MRISEPSSSNGQQPHQHDEQHKVTAAAESVDDVEEEDEASIDEEQLTTSPVNEEIQLAQNRTNARLRTEEAMQVRNRLYLHLFILDDEANARRPEPRPVERWAEGRSYNAHRVKFFFSFF